MQKELSNYITAKIIESQARAERIKAEEAILLAVGNDKLEGSKSVETATHKITITNKINRVLDQEKYEEIKDALPIDFVGYKPVIRLKLLKLVEAVDPAAVSHCVTTKPAKPTVKVVEL